MPDIIIGDEYLDTWNSPPWRFKIISQFGDILTCESVKDNAPPCRFFQTVERFNVVAVSLENLDN